ncbi:MULTISPECIES: GntR family transcriptional regulator [Kitasatospora]|uniref:Putative GntR family transcriptional regulator n=1 Tax=Kitasatospora setae (strain ATCC 33774 / DSM 43861 / JCM 3304 / KCC A-0304 / NBRC 14216 / KM-6054) TaxID=452652 RepID=E4NHE3_KITSK|nr:MULTISPECIES: GntR family transcriptional regulator [Kitasatospora]BAJ30923.1 putative GntR family transcriptional regulator [Kitasatospora setae KM-6054]
MPSQDPPYLRIADHLRRRVTAGEWAVGERLPSRARLAGSYGVGPNVLQRAQEVLIAEGLLEGRTGSGTYVREPVERLTMVRSRTAGLFPAALTPDGEWESDSSARTAASEEVARRLRIEPGALTVHTRYEFRLGDRIVQLADSWEPMGLTGGSPVLLPEYGPLHGRGVVARMAAIGVRVVRAAERLRPSRANAEQAALLGITAGDAVTLIERTYLDDSGRPVETADLVIPDSRWDICYELPLETAE